MFEEPLVLRQVDKWFSNWDASKQVFSSTVFTIRVECPLESESEDGSDESNEFEETDESEDDIAKYFNLKLNILLLIKYYIIKFIIYKIK